MPIQDIGNLGRLRTGGYPFNNQVVETFDVEVTGLTEPFHLIFEDTLGRISGFVPEEDVFVPGPVLEYKWDSLGTKTVAIVATIDFKGVTVFDLIGQRPGHCLLKMDTLDLSQFEDLEEFRIYATSTVNATDEGHLSASRMPTQGFLRWHTDRIASTYDSELLGGLEHTSIQANKNVDFGSARAPTKVLYANATSTHDGSKLTPGGLIDATTEEIWMSRGGPDMDTSTATGFGVDNIGDNSLVSNIKVFSRRTIGPDPAAPLLRAWRQLTRFDIQAPGDDFSEPNLFPDSIEILGGEGMGIYMQDCLQPSVADWRRMFNGLKYIDLRVSGTYNYVNSEPQMMRFWNGLYEAAINGEADPKSEIKVQEAFGGKIWTGSKDDTYKVVGVGPYHPVNASGSAPHNIVDAVGSLSTLGYMNRQYTRESDTVLRIAQSADDGKSTAELNNNRYAFEPASAGGDDVLWIYSRKESTGTFWKRGYAPGDLIRLVTSSEDVFVEVKDSTYDSANGEVVIEIETGTGREPGAVDVLPTGDGDSMHYHYVNSLDVSA